MDCKSRQRSLLSQIMSLRHIATSIVYLYLIAQPVAANNTTVLKDEINLGNNSVNLTKTNGTEEITLPKEVGGHSFKLEKDPVTGELDFNVQTMDIQKINKEKEKEKKEKQSIIQKDLESRIKVEEKKPEEKQTVKETTLSPKEIEDRNTKVQQDIESRIIPQESYEYDEKNYRNEDYDGKIIRRADYSYYDDELPMEARIQDLPMEARVQDLPMEARIQDQPIAYELRSTTESAKEESFFSIFESLFGSDDDISSKNDEIKEIKHVGEILKPIKNEDYRDYVNYDSYSYQKPPPRNNYRPPQPQGNAPLKTYGTQESHYESFNRSPINVAVKEKIPPYLPGLGNHDNRRQDGVVPPGYGPPKQTYEPKRPIEVQQRYPEPIPSQRFPESAGYSETPVKPFSKPINAYEVSEDSYEDNSKNYPKQPQFPDSMEVPNKPQPSETQPINNFSNKPNVLQNYQSPVRERPDRFSEPISNQALALKQTAAPTTTTTIKPIVKQTTIRNELRETVKPTTRHPEVEKRKTERPLTVYEKLKREQEKREKDEEKKEVVKSEPTRAENYIERSDEYYPKPSQNEINKFDRIQDQPNFYNFINLPVHYSTKDTAIPLISSSYANTKVQGLGATKYKNTASESDKFSNHKYDVTTTKRPTVNPWTRRSTQRPATTTARPNRRTTPVDIGDYDYMQLGDSALLGGFGHKSGVDVAPEKVTTEKPISRATTTTVKPITTTTTRKPLTYNSRRSTTAKPTTTSTTTIKTTTSTTTTTTTTARPTTTSTTSTTSTESPKYSIIDLKKNESKETINQVGDFDDYEYESYPAQVYPIDPKTQIRKDNPYEVYPTKQSEYNFNRPEEETKPTKLAENAEEYEYYDEEDEITTRPSQEKSTKPPKTEFSQYDSEELSKEDVRHEYEKPTKLEDMSKYKTDSNSKYTSTEESEYNQYDTSYQSTKHKQTVTKYETTTQRRYERPRPTQESEEKIAVVVPMQKHEFYNEPKPNRNEIHEDLSYDHSLVKDDENWKQNPAPVHEVFEDITTRPPFTTTTTTGRYTTTKQAAKIKPIIVTAGSSEENNNVNIVLVPAKPNLNTPPPTTTEKQRTTLSSTVETRPTAGPQYHRPTTEIYNRPFYGYTTEFTVGAVQGGSQAGGHYVASSIVLSPYGGQDEPFRPIPRPPGMSASFQVVDNDSSEPKPPVAPAPILTSKSDSEEASHESHQFVPSPQFHRPGDAPVLESMDQPPQKFQTENSFDYDFDGIQTEPKPGQYVIFPKPQLNPEINENQFKNKLEINYGGNKSKKPIPHYHDGEKLQTQETRFKVPQESEEKLQNVPFENKIRPVEEEPEKRPQLSLSHPEIDRPINNLQPPRVQENFHQKPEATVINYPRPHWEKNGKPNFLGNPHKNEHFRNPGGPGPHPGSGAHPGPHPGQGPLPNSAEALRYRKPIPPNRASPPLRKSDVIKPKPNLPNILPQFRPNAKVGGPYHRPFRQPLNNRRNNGPPGRYESFPYHIQGVDKAGLVHREYEMEDEIVPKYITHRRKLPEPEQIAQDRSGVGPMNVETVGRGYEWRETGPPSYKTLKRHQRTPVTTLQKLKQTQGVRHHKNPVVREDTLNLTAPMVPPVFKHYKEDPVTRNKTVYVVYPANSVPERRYTSKIPAKPVYEPKRPDNFPYNQKKPDQIPLLNPTKKPNYPKNQEFPYGYVKPQEDRLKLNRKEETLPKNKDVKPNLQDYMPVVTKATETTEKIDMNLHLQNNNQWNKVEEISEVPQSPPVTQAPVQLITKSQTPFRITDYPTGSTEAGIIINLQNPSSQYQTLKKDAAGSEVTVGAVMHTVQQKDKKGEVESVPLDEDSTKHETRIPLVNLNVKVNERISNGKIVTVSMPLDTKQDEIEDRIDNAPIHEDKRPITSSVSEKFNFQAPFQPSVSIDANQGWSSVNDDSNSTDTEALKKKFDIENFKPQLQSGFKPIYDVPDEELEKQNARLEQQKKEMQDRDERYFR